MRDTRVYLFLCLFFLSTMGEASLKHLSGELLKNNADLYRASAEKEKSQYDKDLLLSAYAFTFEGAANARFNQLATSSSVDFSPDQYINVDGALKYKMRWGGEIMWKGSLGNTKTPPFLNFAESSLNHFSHTLTLSQDLSQNLFGKKLNMQVMLTDEAAIRANLKEKEVMDKLLLDLALKYISAQVKSEMVLLQQEALRRTNKRKVLIDNRVKDGLNEQVDFLDAQIRVSMARERLDLVKLDFDEALHALGLLIHRKVVAAEISKMVNRQWALGSMEFKQNATLLALKSQMKMVKSSMNILQRDFLPMIKSHLSYQTNQYNESIWESFSGGLPGSDNHQYIIGLSLSFPIDNKMNEIKKQKLVIDKMNLQHQKKKLQINLDQYGGLLARKLKTFNSVIKNFRLRKALAEKKLKEYNNLYLQGRADLDQVIRAEEELINADLLSLSTLAKKLGLIYNYYFLNGNLLKNI